MDTAARAGIDYMADLDHVAELVGVSEAEVVRFVQERGGARPRAVEAGSPPRPRLELPLPKLPEGADWKEYALEVKKLDEAVTPAQIAA